MKGRLTFDTKQGEDGDHYWFAEAHNGDTVCDGSEGYTRKGDAKKAAKHLIAMIERGLYDIEGEQGKVK